jgi:hypothetical protein
MAPSLSSQAAAALASAHICGICAPGQGRREDRGALFHAVQIIITEAGAIAGRVLQAFDPVDGHARFTFGDIPRT